MSLFPVVITKAGLQPLSPQVLRAALVARAEALAPGITTNLPGSLIEDLTSTGVGVLAECDSAKVDTVNSLTPYGANEFTLNWLGVIYGVQPGSTTNTSAYVVFTGTPGFVINPGFVVSDGAHQYIIQNGGIIESGGSSAPLFVIATVAGSWAVPENTITTIITSVPGSITLSVNNPQSGIPSAGGETAEQFRYRVMQAGMATCQGTQQFLKTQIQNVAGVQQRLVSVRKLLDGKWQVIVGGGDPYAVASAIYRSMCDIAALEGSTIRVTAITNANPGVVETDLDHGLTTGEICEINGALGISGINGVPLTATVISPTSFSIGIDTTSSGAYVGGGVLTPNTRNVSVSIIDYPDTYSIPFVVPPQQSVFMEVTWNTTATNVVSDANVAALGNAALLAYINAIPAGQPINLFELQTTFQVAIAELVPPALLTRMVFTVAIDGVGVPPEAGTGIIAGDPESFFYINPSDIVISRG